MPVLLAGTAAFNSFLSAKRLFRNLWNFDLVALSDGVISNINFTTRKNVVIYKRFAIDVKIAVIPCRIKAVLMFSFFLN